MFVNLIIYRIFQINFRIIFVYYIYNVFRWKRINQVYFYTTHQILDGVMRLEEVSLWQY